MKGLEGLRDWPCWRKSVALGVGFEVPKARAKPRVYLRVDQESRSLCYRLDVTLNTPPTMLLAVMIMD